MAVNTLLESLVIGKKIAHIGLVSVTSYIATTSLMVEWMMVTISL